MIKKIFLFFILIMSGLGAFFTLNIVLLGKITHLFFSEEMTPMVFVSIFLGLSIIFIFTLKYFYGKYKNDAEKGWLILFGVYLTILVVAYFGSYKDYTEYEKIDNLYFKTNLQDIEVNEEENGLALLSKIKGTTEYQLYSDSIDCLLSGSDSAVCDYSEETKKLKQKGYFNDEVIEEAHKIYEKLVIIVDKKYFKQRFNIYTDEYDQYLGFGGMSRDLDDEGNAKGHIQKPYYLTGLRSDNKSLFYSALHKFENGQSKKGLDIVLLNYKISEKILHGDIGIIGFQIGKNLLKQSVKQLEYIVNNYQLTEFELQQIEGVIHTKIDVDLIYSNMVKYDYNEHINDYEMLLFRGLYHDNIFFDKEKFRHMLSNIYKQIMEGKFTSEDKDGYAMKYNEGKNSFIMKQFVVFTGLPDGSFKRELYQLIKQRDTLVLKIKKMMKLKGNSKIESILLNSYKKN